MIRVHVHKGPWRPFRRFRDEASPFLPGTGDQRIYLATAVNSGTNDAGFKEDEHPRGQPSNAGQFAKGSGGTSKPATKPATSKSAALDPASPQDLEVLAEVMHSGDYAKLDQARLRAPLFAAIRGEEISPELRTQLGEFIKSLKLKPEAVETVRKEQAEDRRREERSQKAKQAAAKAVQSGGNVTVWHGTSDEFLRSIQQHGLDVSQIVRRVSDDVGFYKGKNGQSIYVSPEPELARTYAQEMVDQGPPGTQGIVLEIEIPAAEVKKLRPDEASDEGTAFKFPKKIPPEWIKRTSVDGKEWQGFPRRTADRGRRLFFHVGDRAIRLRDADWEESEHPRNRSGEFTKGAGASSGASKPEPEASTPASAPERPAPKRDVIANHQHRQALVDEIAQQYGLDPVEVRMNDLGTDHALGTAGGRTHINLNEKFFTPENLAKWAKEWHGMTVGADKDDPQATAEAVILHELGHVMMHQIEGQSPQGTSRSKAVQAHTKHWRAVQDLAEEYHAKQNGGNVWPVSVYGQENPSEFAAEAFAAAHLGQVAKSGTEAQRQQALDHAKEFWQKLRALKQPQAAAAPSGQPAAEPDHPAVSYFGPTLRNRGFEFKEINEYGDAVYEHPDGFRVTAEGPTAANNFAAPQWTLRLPDGRIKIGTGMEIYDVLKEANAQNALEKMTPEEKQAHTKKLALSQVKKLGYDPAKVAFRDDVEHFEVNGRQYTKGGYASFGDGVITIFTHVDPKHVEALTAHETMHQKFNTVLEDYRAERARIQKDDRNARAWIMKPDGELRDEYKADYPVYSALEPVLDRGDVGTRLRKRDGVTQYSRDYWEEFEKNETSLEIAIHETLAEMARQDSEGKIEAAPVWKALYRTVNKVYKDRHWGGT